MTSHAQPTTPRQAAPAAEPPLLVVQLAGTQAEMGAQHGRLLARLGGHTGALGFYPTLAERMLFGTLGPRGAAWAARAFVPFKAAALAALEHARPREYRARSEAFLEAAGWPARDARYLTVMDLFQNLVGLAGRAGVGPFAGVPACSTLVAWGGASRDGALRHARNFDFPGIGLWDRAPVVVFCDPDRGLRYGFVTTRGADTPGVTAWNEAGLVLTAHTRFHRDVAFSGAAVVDLGHDIVRRAETLADASRIARERRVASTWGLCVSSARERRAVVIETSAARVEVVEPPPGAEHLACANRYRHPAMQRGELASSPAWAAHSDARERRLAERVAAGPLDAAALEEVLADARDPEAPARPRGSGGLLLQACTVQSVVIEPEARAVRLSVGAAPTSLGPFVRVPWRWGGPAVELPRAARVAVTAAERALACFVEAARLMTATHDHGAALAALERAVALEPDDPSYRLLAGGLALRLGRFAAARAHLEHGLVHEASPFRRGQLLLWAARAADVSGAPGRAGRLRAELAAETDPRLAPLLRVARRDARRPFSRARARRVAVHLLLADLE